ncbi:tetratricopeptide repeat-containing sensor histidine kinase [Sinomicrobium pectinilyticum]|uniref:histidine kinase n=1 Tax=Sinomicrobium pectinilyticum TaxID=1084421 RepID=A0A3N0EIU6_SINP1|nr:tetratricopeptide repeat-containing sensor histidine kinase [Sinomicrobium pectinilyticum]RNL87803.1 tetratricopeptide repeat-containing sensor histidine kinase [Sinomicrobium pectinilyticum]
MKTCKLKYPYAIFFFAIVLAICSACENSRHPAPQLQTEKDSIATWLKKAGQDTMAHTRRQFLAKAYNLALQQKAPLKQEYLSKIAYQASLLQDSSLFKKANKEAMRLVLKIRDTAGIADTHWNYGAFYLDRENYDSAYYHYHRAQKLFEDTGDTYYSGKMLYNMAYIRGRIKDYTGCEVLLFQAISRFQPQDRYKQLYNCYNHLGVVYEELKEYDKAITYHKRALDYLGKMDDKSVFLQDSQNNIGLIYQKQGNQEEALYYFNEALQTPGLESDDVELYTRLMENRAFSRFLDSDTTQLPQDFYRALRVWEDRRNTSGIILGKLRLARYYIKYNDSARARDLAREAYDLARKIRNNRDILSALLFLAGADRENGPEYLQEYIRLSTDIQEQERRTRDKFTRIQYETDQYIEKTRQLSSQKMWILTVGIALVLLLLLLYILNRQFARNKLLHMENLQQKANEQIYLLSLKQQAKLQEGRNQERIRISEELHDSILGDLFAIRIDWGFLKLQGDPDSLQKHRYYLQELQRIERDIREASHELRNEPDTYPLNFIFIVEKLVQKRANTGRFKYRLVHDDSIAWEDIDEVIKVNLYRVIEEALQNCIKHAGTTLVEVQFQRKKNNLLQLTIRDNGIGFNPRKRHKGIGIKNMQSRIRKLRGTFHIHSQKDRGTVLTVSIPI